MRGLIGWLSPVGTFHPCKYGEHHILAEQIYDYFNSSAESNGYIPLSKGHIGIHTVKALTKPQIRWFLLNYQELSPEQQEMFDWYWEQNGAGVRAS